MKRIYFDNGSTSFPKAPGVSDAVKFLLDNGAFNINRGGYEEAYSAAEVVEKNHLVHEIILAEEPTVDADTTLAVIEYAAKPFFGTDTTYTVALYQAKEDASITEAMWSYKKTPVSKDANLERIATVTIVTNNKTGDVLSDIKCPSILSLPLLYRLKGLIYADWLHFLSCQNTARALTNLSWIPCRIIITSICPVP